MEGRRQELLGELERYYRGCGWQVERAADGTVRAAGTGGVTWIGMAVVAADLDDDGFGPRLVELSDVREDDGARCPFELLPDASCAGAVKSLLAQLRLTERVSVYSLAA
ncbi:MAG: hypothetical protein ACYDCH_07370 [Gaiellaceae bacterium]